MDYLQQNFSSKKIYILIDMTVESNGSHTTTSIISLKNNYHIKLLITAVYYF